MNGAVTQVPTIPFEGQSPGTSGLRKKVSVFQQPHYIENFIQAIFDCLGNCDGKTLVVGGDGRFLNEEAIQIVLKVAAANGVSRAVVGQNGILSTPAASNLIRQRRALGGIVLSASHNPGGIDGDFGIKFNVENGGPAPEKITDAIFARTKQISAYRILAGRDADLGRLGLSDFGAMQLEIVDPVADYQRLMESLFDFEAIRDLFRSGFRLCFDAMSAVTGPYAVAIFEGALGAAPGTVIHRHPLPDFGGRHPDPNLAHARALFDLAMTTDAPDLCAASDGDGDRNLIIGRGLYVTPSDSLAVLAANARLAPAFRAGLSGVARSMPTSRALDRVAAALKIALCETPTGWKYFGNLLDAGLVEICGEESAGTGASHVREKDGLWAILLWLNILAVRRQSVAAIVHGHWRQYGRDYYCRHDYEEVETAGASELIESLRRRLPRLPGQHFAGLAIAAADDFAYHDPVDGTDVRQQGLRVFFVDGSRIVYRLSGTGTSGATLRVYIERFEANAAAQNHDTQQALAPLIRVSRDLAEIRRYTGRDRPSVIT